MSDANKGIINSSSSSPTGLAAGGLLGVALTDEQAANILKVKDAREAARFEQLPAAQETGGNINFLGSSYSGVDLKVVAHLYDTPQHIDEKMSDLQRKKLEAQLILDGLNALTGGGLAGLAIKAGLFEIDTRRSVFLGAAGLAGQTSPEAAVAQNFMLFSILGGNGFDNASITRMTNLAIGSRGQFLNAVREYESQISSLQKQVDTGISSTVVLASLQTISIQSFREKNAVRAMGHSYAKGYTRGTRTIGGSMIFTIFHEHALRQLISSMGNSQTYGERDTELSTLLPDQLPPIDITLVFANEFGARDC